ncbi:leucine, tRNA ligase [Mycolicibacterium thermoresistibile]|uniref:Leucine, tRNA ligase n=1 Tax=Mycolicibacterium thermoresistibile TaxID=1797 RepID=A0A100XD59_MYCTH|nr:leucine, tRNA ligase [Mycolicibacterium thermoresistibile]
MTELTVLDTALAVHCSGAADATGTATAATIVPPSSEPAQTAANRRRVEVLLKFMITFLLGTELMFCPRPGFPR